MTETPEIPEAAAEAAARVFYGDAYGSVGAEGNALLLGGAREALAAALPHLNPEPTFTASEVKVLTETATRLGVALGRKEAATEVAEAIRRSASAHYSPGHDEVMIPHETALGLALEIASRVPERGSEPLIAPTGHSDLPPTPEARKCGHCGFYNNGLGLKHHPKCPHATPDLPEGRDQ